jgi:hypothetical protein
VNDLARSGRGLATILRVRAIPRSPFSRSCKHTQHIHTNIGGRLHWPGKGSRSKPAGAARTGCPGGRPGCICGTESERSGMGRSPGRRTGGPSRTHKCSRGWKQAPSDSPRPPRSRGGKTTYTHRTHQQAVSWPEGLCEAHREGLAEQTHPLDRVLDKPRINDIYVAARCEKTPARTDATTLRNSPYMAKRSSQSFLRGFRELFG